MVWLAITVELLRYVFAIGYFYKMPQFAITAEVIVEAKNKQEAIYNLEKERHNEAEQSELAYDLLANAEVTEL